MNLEWDVEFLLIPSVNAAGTTPGLVGLPFNELVSVGEAGLGYFFLDSSKCSAGAARRITRNNLAQADGEITHRKFKSGYIFEINTQLWETTEDPACAGSLRVMADILAEYLEAVANNDGQLVWFPSAWPEGSDAPNPRLLDQCRSMGPSGNDATGASFVSVVTEKDENAKLWDVTFALLSPFPYVTDFMNYPDSPDEVVDFANGTSGNVTINNDGNVDYHPVLRVYGPSDAFTLVNESVVDEIGNPLQIVYDTSLPGASSLTIPSGGYVEIDTFKSLVKLHQAGGGTDNAKSAINVLETDFFALAPGANVLSLTWMGGGAGMGEVVYRNAWA